MGKVHMANWKKVARALQTVSRKWLIVKQTRVKVGDGSVKQSWSVAVLHLPCYTMLNLYSSHNLWATRSKTPKPHRKTVAWVDYVHLASKCGSEVSPQRQTRKIRFRWNHLAKAKGSQRAVPTEAADGFWDLVWLMVTARGKRKKRRRRKRKMGLGQKGELSSYGGTNWMKGGLTRHSGDEDDHSLQHLLKDQAVQTPKLSITKEAQWWVVPAQSIDGWWWLKGGGPQLEEAP